MVSWGNSFGYLTPRESAASLAGMHVALRPGGRLILEWLTVADGESPFELGSPRMIAVADA